MVLGVIQLVTREYNQRVVINDGELLVATKSNGLSTWRPTSSQNDHPTRVLAELHTLGEVIREHTATVIKIGSNRVPNGK